MLDSLAHYILLLRKDFVEFCNQKLQERGLSQGLIYFILYIGKHEGCSPKTLCEALQMDLSHITRSLVRLQQTGFIRQEKNPKDGRGHLLYLTEQGKEAFAYSYDLFVRWDQKIMQNMTPEMQTNLLYLLQQAITNKETNDDV